jgi:hypothetical protein
MKDQGPKTDECKNSAHRETERTQLFGRDLVSHRFTRVDPMFNFYRAKPPSTQSSESYSFSVPFAP